jgi:hypothetical protein
MTTTIIPINLIGPTLDKIDTTMQHLQGMLAMTFGEAFGGMPRDRRDVYMRGCAALVDECIALSQHTVDITIAVDTDFKTAMTA